MNKSLLIGILAGVGGAVAVTAVATRTNLHFGGDYAEVVEVKPLTKTVSTPRQECHDEQVVRQKPVQDQHRIAGTAIGAVLGGVLGHQIGGGNGRKLATVAGAAAGGYAGNQVQDHLQKNDTETVTEQRCSTTYDKSETPDGFRVTYKLNGKTTTVKMSHDPGSKIPLKDGKPDLSAGDAPKAPAG